MPAIMADVELIVSEEFCLKAEGNMRKLEKVSLSSLSRVESRDIPNHYQERGYSSSCPPIPSRLVFLIVEIYHCPPWPPLGQ